MFVEPREAPCLSIEKNRCSTVGASFLGIIGDANHTWGYHVPAYKLPSDDYSMAGSANRPDDASCACAIDIGMDWPAAREWIRWLIRSIRSDAITGIAEVIGSLDGHTARYWSDADGWDDPGVPYQGTGHVSWTHVAIYRSNSSDDRRLLAGWTPTGYEKDEDDDMPQFDTGQLANGFAIDRDGTLTDRSRMSVITIPPVNGGSAKWGPAWLSLGCDMGSASIRIAIHNGRGWGDIETLTLNSSDARRSISLPTGAGKISLARVDTAGTEDDVPVSWAIEYAASH